MVWITAESVGIVFQGVWGSLTVIVPTMLLVLITAVTMVFVRQQTPIMAETFYGLQCVVGKSVPDSPLIFALTRKNRTNCHRICVSLSRHVGAALQSPDLSV